MPPTGLPARRFALLLSLCLVLAGALLMPGAARADTIRVGGTGAALGTMKMLAEGYRKIDPAFAMEIVPNLGSSGGIKALKAGAVQIGVISRALLPEEVGSGLQSVEYGTTALVLATAKNGVRDLTLEQIAELYSGKQAKWSDGQPVRLVLRPASDSDTALLGMFSPAVKNALAIAMAREGMVVAMTDQDSADSIERLPGAIGTSSLALLKSENRRAIALSIAGVEPTVANLTNGSYPYIKRMYMLVTVSPSATVSKFIAFVGSEAGRRILDDAGHVAAHGPPAKKPGLKTDR